MKVKISLFLLLFTATLIGQRSSTFKFLSEYKHQYSSGVKLDDGFVATGHIEINDSLKTLVTKVNDSLQVEWSKTLHGGLSWQEYGKKIFKRQNGNYIVYSNDTHFSEGGNLYSISPNGNINWRIHIDINSTYREESAKLVNDSILIVYGEIKEWWSSDRRQSLSQRPFILKLNLNTKKRLWGKIYSGRGGFSDLILDHNGNMMVLQNEMDNYYTTISYANGVPTTDSVSYVRGNGANYRKILMTKDSLNYYILGNYTSGFDEYAILTKIDTSGNVIFSKNYTYLTNYIDGYGDRYQEGATSFTFALNNNEIYMWMMPVPGESEGGEFLLNLDTMGNVNWHRFYANTKVAKAPHSFQNDDEFIEVSDSIVTVISSYDSSWAGATHGTFTKVLPLKSAVGCDSSRVLQVQDIQFEYSKLAPLTILQNLSTFLRDGEYSKSDLEFKIDTLCWECTIIKAKGQGRYQEEENLVKFTNLSIGADSVIWLFHEGDTSRLDTFYKFLPNGVHHYTLEAYNECAADTATLYVYLDNVVSSNKLEFQANIYPNPSQGTINIDYNPKIGQIEIYGIDGNKVFSSGYSSSIDIQNLKRGIYSMIIFNQEGDRLQTLKIVKK